jgi:hypothetical protein
VRRRWAVAWRARSAINRGIAGRERFSSATRWSRLTVLPVCRGGEMADAEDSKSSVRKHMRVQVPPSAPKFSRQLQRPRARKALTVNSPARKSRLTLTELWLFLNWKRGPKCPKSTLLFVSMRRLELTGDEWCPAGTGARETISACNRDLLGAS